MEPILKRFEYGEDQVVRELTIQDQAWFLAKDVCDILDISDTRQAVERLDDDEKLMGKVHLSGQHRETWLINESGLYNLVFTSSKPEAKKFKKWVTSVVLPEIRKEGRFSSEQEVFRNRRMKELLTEVRRQKTIFYRTKKTIAALEQEFRDIFDASPSQLHIFESMAKGELG